MQIGKRKTVAIVVMLTIILIASITGWLAPSYTLGSAGAVLGFIGRRLDGAVTGHKLEIGLLVAAGFALEIILMGWRNSSVFRLLFTRSRSATIDTVIFAVVMLGLIDIITIIITFGISVETGRVVNWIISQYGWNRIEMPTEGALPLAGAFAIYWLLTTFLSYWTHRLMHTPYLWHLHRFHHAATELNIITLFREHPVEPVVLNLLSVVSPLLFFKVSDPILFMYLLVATTSDFLAHSHLPWTYGWIGSWIIHSPRVHQVYHSVEDEHRDLHFSGCPLWDHVFGTWYTGTKAPSAYGILNNQYEQRPFRQLLSTR